MYHQGELCEGVGRRVQETDGDLHPMLDGDTPQRPPAVAGQGPHPDGGPRGVTSGVKYLGVIWGVWAGCKEKDSE